MTKEERSTANKMMNDSKTVQIVGMFRTLKEEFPKLKLAVSIETGMVWLLHEDIPLVGLTIAAPHVMYVNSAPEAETGFIVQKLNKLFDIQHLLAEPLVFRNGAIEPSESHNESLTVELESPSIKH